MGWKLKKKEICLEPNEEKDIVLELRPENRAAIHGIVRFPDNTPAKDAIVKLFKKTKHPCKLIPVTFAFTDECGQFLFGVDSGIDYVVKVFFYTPEHKVCDPKDHCDSKDDCDW